MYGVYHIPASQMVEGGKLCAGSAQDFWLTGKIAMENGSLNLSLGLYILSVEEIGKFVPLLEARREGIGNGFTLDERSFKNHRLKQRKGLAQMKEWGCDPPPLVPLTQEERERLWFVSWDEQKKQFGREFTPNLGNVEIVCESIRQALNRMDYEIRKLEENSGERQMPLGESQRQKPETVTEVAGVD